VQRIHIMNPTDEVLQPVVLHLPPYLTAQVSPSKLAPRHRLPSILARILVTRWHPRRKSVCRQSFYQTSRN
jgi:hypothetical protein